MPVIKKLPAYVFQTSSHVSCCGRGGWKTYTVTNIFSLLFNQM